MLAAPLFAVMAEYHPFLHRFKRPLVLQVEMFVRLVAHRACQVDVAAALRRKALRFVIFEGAVVRGSGRWLGVLVDPEDVLAVAPVQRLVFIANVAAFLSQLDVPRHVELDEVLGLLLLPGGFVLQDSEVLRPLDVMPVERGVVHVVWNSIL